MLQNKTEWNGARLNSREPAAGGRVKRLYEVYAVARRCFGDFVTTERYFVSSTFAVSEKKAVNNVRFKLGESRNFYEDSDIYSDDWREFFYQAVPSGTVLSLFEKTTRAEYFKEKEAERVER